MRGRQFGFGSRLSNGDSNSGGGSNSGSDRGFHRVPAHNLSASCAASEEQGNSSMCSFDGFFINITEEQLNKPNEDEDSEIVNAK